MARDFVTESSPSAEPLRVSSADAASVSSRGPAATDWRTVMRNLIREHDRNVCMHEETRRGGLIWTICCECGARWADDRGGFKAYEEPAAVTAAWAILAAADEPERTATPSSAPTISQARPLSDWTEEDGDVLWWRFPIEEPPYCGSPNDLGQDVLITVSRWGHEDGQSRHMVGGWPGYHTHWTPIPVPGEPPAPCDEPPKGEDAPSAAEGRSPASAVGESRGAHE